MPKFISHERNKVVLYAHIPRTGGRFVTHTMIQNGYIPSYHFAEEHSFTETTVVDRVEAMHFHYPLLAKYYGAEVNPLQFAVVRDPVQRFMSSFWVLNECMKQWEVSHENLENYSYFKLCMEFYTFSRTNNWFRPQVEFIGPLTKVWKYENNLGHDWREWMGEIGVPLLVSNLVHYKKMEFDLFKANNFSSPILDNIRKYYKDDFEAFNYSRLPC